jgi:predicted DNA-binding transcriptional regulator YafY
MSIITSIDKIEQINSLIRFKQTGNPEEFAKKLNVSRSMLYQYIEEMKTLGATIKYSRYSETFYYVNGFNVKVEIRFSIDNNN